MDRKQLISALQSIKKPVVTEFGCFDTGIEFRILTSHGGYFCMGGGNEPIGGPFPPQQIERQALKRLVDAGYEYDPENGNDIRDFIEEHDMV